MQSVDIQSTRPETRDASPWMALLIDRARGYDHGCAATLRRFPG